MAADAVAPEPWRNGGGSTRTLAVWPPIGPWQWRVSLADIVQDGPFSRFDGVQRWFAVVQGDGVRLQWPGRSVALTPADAPLRFEGADPPQGRLIGGPTRDLNLMLRGLCGGLAHARPGEPWAAPRAAAAAMWRGCLAGGPGLLHLGTATLELPGLGLWITGPEEAAEGSGRGPWPSAAEALPWRFEPASPESRAWWLWAGPAEGPAG